MNARKLKAVKCPKKCYATPKLTSHGDVAKLTNRMMRKPRHCGDGPASELS